MQWIYQRLNTDDFVVQWEQLVSYVCLLDDNIHETIQAKFDGQNHRLRFKAMKKFTEENIFAYACTLWSETKA